MSDKITSATGKRTFIDRESIFDKLMLFGTVVGLMATHPEDFGNPEYYGLQTLLYDTAKTVWPEYKQEAEQ